MWSCLQKRSINTGYSNNSNNIAWINKKYKVNHVRLKIKEVQNKNKTIFTKSLWKSNPGNKVFFSRCILCFLVLTQNVLQKYIYLFKQTHTLSWSCSCWFQVYSWNLHLLSLTCTHGQYKAFIVSGKKNECMNVVTVLRRLVTRWARTSCDVNGTKMPMPPDRVV